MMNQFKLMTRQAERTLACGHLSNPLGLDRLLNHRRLNKLLTGRLDMNFTTPRSIGSGTERREAAAGGPYLSPIYYPLYYDRGGRKTERREPCVGSLEGYWILFGGESYATGRNAHTMMNGEPNRQNPIHSIMPFRTYGVHAEGALPFPPPCWGSCSERQRTNQSLLCMHDHAIGALIGETLPRPQQWQSDPQSPVSHPSTPYSIHLPSTLSIYPLLYLSTLPPPIIYVILQTDD